MSTEDKLASHIKASHSFPCKACNLVFTLKKDLNAHRFLNESCLEHSQEDTEKFSCSLCSYSVTIKRNLIMHIKRKHTDEFSILCPECGRGFFNEKELAAHKIEIHGADPFLCIPCNKPFSKIENYRLHQRRYHLNSVNKECKICHKVLRTARLSEHMKQVHYAKLFDCHICGKTVVTEKNYKKHMQLHSDDKPFECQFCRKAFKLKYYLTLKTKSKKSSGISKNENLRPCTLCDKKLASERKLKEHIRKQHPTSVEADLIRREKYEREKVQCPYCAKFLSRKEKLNRHIRTVHTDVNYKCEICGEEFLSKTRYNRHVVTHEEKQKFECECGYVTCNKYRLTEHVRRTHLKDYKVLCPICGYGCFRNAELEEHFISAHSADRFKCVFCEKSFARNCNLKLHIRRYHDKSDNTECPLCGKSFPSRGRLNEHLIQVHPAQKHQCHICNKIVVSEKTLKKHLLLHTNSEPFHCPECGKAFKFKRYVTLHMRTHTGNWPTFVCKICNATISSEYRTKHMQTHDVEKSFLCSICAAGFINDSGLKAHMRKHQ
ncbi:hypothetical protein M8J77_015639 [Diaphorina citri]|nr:hypothetical protein M8J77_007356 [Diaphorina citri]KAI5755279.1 hypothetical protein M8J77_015639 [Diaphorina citri]